MNRTLIDLVKATLKDHSDIELQNNLNGPGFNQDWRQAMKEVLSERGIRIIGKVDSAAKVSAGSNK